MDITKLRKLSEPVDEEEVDEINVIVNITEEVKGLRI